MCFCLENWTVRLLHKATEVVSLEKKNTHYCCIQQEIQ